MINLFPRTSEPLRPDGTRSEYRLVADSHRENSVEIHSIRGMRAMSSQGVRKVPAYYGSQHGNDQTCYWHARRVSGMSPNRMGTDLMVSLVDTQFDPLADTRDYSLTAELLCTNRHLAQSLPAGTRWVSSGRGRWPGRVCATHPAHKACRAWMANRAGGWCRN